MSTPLTAERRIALQGAINCRDLGGLCTPDGRRVRRGMLFRADSLADLSDSDQALLKGLRLRHVFDLRHEDERRLRPNRLPDDAALQVHEIGFYPQGAHSLMARVRQRAIGKDEAWQTMFDMYRLMPIHQAPHFSRLLMQLSGPHGLPALIHCTSGKDRTGVATAMVLSALGVSHQEILSDYLLTNRHRRDLSFMLGTDVDPEVLDVVKAADARFLQAALDVMASDAGGTQGFLRNRLGLTQATQQRLQDQLLEA
ncbi:tyrosine-protein phosphatase [Aquabacterium sp.]|uniref:tyrosine-protein phosphatase n=1 Tax=Aquabacterium sp. TaxID=1872578 RepID=UPI0025BE0CE1|nr:tyrosine-protein phosphatase [Aquabacterium sp.]